MTSNGLDAGAEYLEIAETAQGQVEVISTFLKDLDDAIADGQDLGEVVPKVSQRLNDYKGWAELVAAHDPAALTGERVFKPWVVEFRREGLAFVVKGPADDDSAKIVAENEDEVEDIVSLGFQSGYYIDADSNLVQQTQLNNIAEKVCRCKTYSSTLKRPESPTHHNPHPGQILLRTRERPLPSG